MGITSQLTTQIGKCGEFGNRRVAGMCLENPDLLGEIADGLECGNPLIMRDCAEVMTMVAQNEPEFILPYISEIVPLVDHPKARVRWEAVHALSLIAGLAPHFIRKLLPRFDEIIHNDKSIIARDCAVRAVANYAGTGKSASEDAYPILIKAVYVRDARHGHLAINGLIHALEYLPEKADELEKIGLEFMDAKRGVLKKSARRLLKAIDSIKT